MAHFLEERTLDLEKEHALIGMTLLTAESLSGYHVKPQVPILPLPVQWLSGESRVNLQLDTFGAVTRDRLCLPASRYQPASFSNLHDASPDSS